MASAYRGTRLAPAAVHCDRLVTLAREAAKEARTAAAQERIIEGEYAVVGRPQVSVQQH